jgi:hypothetical protein
MARRVITTMLCDPCLAEGNEVEGEELPPLPLIGNKPRILALCEDHRAEVYDPLVEMVREHGQIVDIEPGPRAVARPARTRTRTRPEREPEPEPESPAEEPVAEYECPDCARSFTTPQGLGAHRSRVHGYRKQEQTG